LTTRVRRTVRLDRDEEEDDETEDNDEAEVGEEEVGSAAVVLPLRLLLLLPAFVASSRLLPKLSKEDSNDGRLRVCSDAVETFTRPILAATILV